MINRQWLFQHFWFGGEVTSEAPKELTISVAGHRFPKCGRLYHVFVLRMESQLQKLSLCFCTPILSGTSLNTEYGPIQQHEQTNNHCIRFGTAYKTLQFTIYTIILYPATDGKSVQWYVRHEVWQIG